MVGLKFDNKTRDVILTGGDFTIENTTDMQNGAIILESKCAILLKPMVGIGFRNIIGSPTATEIYELNRWRSQMSQDGAKSRFTLNADNTLKLEVKYE